MKKYLVAATLVSALLNSGCSVLGSIGSVIFTESTPEEAVHSTAVSRYSPDSLLNYKTARDFAAQGRYELAREHYLLALAAANDVYLQDALTQELESVDMMIRSLR